jgi:GNAT superfamily N-acetyltransferase
MFSIRLAIADDTESICAFDRIAQWESRRKDFIRRSISSGTCYVAVEQEEVIGYGVLSHTFYDNGFIEMLFVHPGHRQQGVAAALLAHLESRCQTPKLFTSTNLSNLPMQSLLSKQGYTPSGVIHNLDEGDPELVYFKRLT